MHKDTKHTISKSNFHCEFFSFLDSSFNNFFSSSCRSELEEGIHENFVSCLHRSR